MMSPRVSVVMTIYNAGPYLQPALDSLSAQTFRDFELVAVENGSSDGSKQRIRDFAAIDSRVQVIELPDNIGRVPALNLALDKARGDYVAILDADDVAHPDRLSAQVALLDAKPEVVLVSAHARGIDGEGRVTDCFAPNADPASLRDALAFANPFSHSACTFRRQVALDAGGYSPRYPIANDLALWIALSRKGEIAMIARPLADIRSHASNTTNATPYAASRFYEELELYESMRSYAGLTMQARQANRVTVSRLHFNIAKRFFAAGKPGQAAIELVRCFLSAPIFVLRQFVKSTVSRAQQNS